MAEKQTKSTVISDKRQSRILIGIALIIVGILIIYIAVSQPKTVSKTESSENTSSVTLLQNSAESSENSSTQSSSKIEKDPNIIVNINTCSAEDLMKIKGIGESKANAIIAYRNVIGSYSNTEEVKNISGFSDKFYDSIKDNITV